MRVALSILAIAACLFLVQASARFGFSRLLSRYAEVMNSVSVADEAVRLGPSDPETHRARAAVLSRLKMFPEANQSFEHSVSLRSQDDRLWIQLGSTREEAGDNEGALAALNEAVRLAPYYAHPHWQRGNLLLRLGRTGEAFADLRQAANSNPKYFPNLIDLAWGLSRGDVRATAELGGVNDDAERFALIRFLASRGKGAEVVDQTTLLTTPLSSEKNQELVRSLFAAKAFRAAFQILGVKDLEPVFLNSGFEESLFVNDSGVGWIVAAEKGNRVAIDVSEKFEGVKSLQIVLEGNWTPGTPLLSQTLLVAPEKTYRISFAVKTKDLVTGGPPFITVNDATNNQLLAKSENLPTASSSWVTVNFEFSTLPALEAVVIRLHRNNCEPAPCPIFGTLWLDQFHIMR
jgi:hypothetical protein